MRKSILAAGIMLALGAGNTLADCSNSFEVTVNQNDINLSSDQQSNGTKAVAHIFASGALDKPVIVVEGLDLENNLGCEWLESKINNKYNLIDDLNLQGKDVILVNFHDTLLGIEANGHALAKIISTVNQMKTGNHSNAVIGLSMGGLVSRYALTYLEHYGVDHETRLFVSYDSPQKYANLPAELMGFMPVVRGQEGMDIIDDIFGSLSVKQMLVTRPFWSDENLIDTNQNGVNEVYIDLTDYNSELMEKLSGLGNYPANLRKVAFSNGSAEGAMGKYLFGPGDSLMSFIIDIEPFKRINIHQVDLSSFETSLECIESETEKHKRHEELGYIPSFMEGTVNAKCTVAPKYPSSLGLNPTIDDIAYDNAPGSYGSIMNNIMQNIPPDVDLEIINHQDKISFIPTISALDIRTSDKSYGISNDPHILGKTPFDEIYYPYNGVNEEHLSLTSDKYHQLLSELDQHHVDLSDFEPIPAPLIIESSLQTSFFYPVTCNPSSLRWSISQNEFATHFEIMTSPNIYAEDSEWENSWEASYDSNQFLLMLKTDSYVGIRACNESNCSEITKFGTKVKALMSFCPNSM